MLRAKHPGRGNVSPQHQFLHLIHESSGVLVCLVDGQKPFYKKVDGNHKHDPDGDHDRSTFKCEFPYRNTLICRVCYRCGICYNLCEYHSVKKIIVQVKSMTQKSIRKKSCTVANTSLPTNRFHSQPSFHPPLIAR